MLTSLDISAIQYTTCPLLLLHILELVNLFNVLNQKSGHILQGAPLKQIYIYLEPFNRGHCVTSTNG